MKAGAGDTETLVSYLQADASGRARLFPQFIKALEAQARTPGAARSWAAQAVSPDLDYSSLRRLRKFLAPEPNAADKVCVRVAVLGGPTTTQLVELIGVFLAGANIPVQVFEGDYGLYRQEILTPGSDLDRFAPQIILLATGAREISRFPAQHATPTEIEALAEAELDGWARLWDAAGKAWGATVIQNNFECEPWGIFGHYAARHPASRVHYTDRLNRLFSERAPANVVLHDLRALAAEAGAGQWFDPRFYLEAKMPCGPEALVGYAHSVMALIRAAVGRSKKVLVLDLDNTLWGGVVGDVGPGGIQVGQGTGEGEAFAAFQAHAKGLQERGIVLAVCSKNDEANAREPFQTRPDMVLKLEDFACFLANWKDKAENLRTIAASLDLGIDSLVFVDDNPAERALVRRLVPDVATPDMPEDPAGFIQALAKHRYFEAVSYTAEDSQRSAYYVQNARRAELASRSEDLAAFLASLEMVARIEPVGRLNLERVAQLVNKSNQFNLTTRRYTAAEIERLSADENWRTLTISLRDNVGDNGLISVLLMRRTGMTLTIDTWLMSCRVLQRGVEQLALSLAIRQARELGCDRLTGVYVPTAKNGMVKEHYARLGFTRAGNEGETTFWDFLIPENYEAPASAIRLED
jgi:FkbH-like protein